MWKFILTRGTAAWGRVLVATSTEWVMWLCHCPLACVEDGEHGVLSRRGKERLGGGVKEDWPTPLGQHLGRWCRRECIRILSEVLLRWTNQLLLRLLTAVFSLSCGCCESGAGGQSARSADGSRISLQNITTIATCNCLLHNTAM